MLIEENPFNHWLNNFYGYGSWQAPIWFIAHEEGGGDLPEEVAEKLNYFYKLHATSTEATLCNLRELYRHVAVRYEGPKADLYMNQYQYRFGSNAILHGVWKNLIAFKHGYRDEKLPDILTYQKNSFASPSEHSEAMIRLYPLPSPHNHGWYYSWLDMPKFPFLKSRTMYQEHIYQTRIHNIINKITAYKPELVLMYGMENINGLKKSFQEFFDATKFKMVKAIKQQIPQHHRADLNGTVLLITTQIPALRHQRIETGFDWEQFGRTVNR